MPSFFKRFNKNIRKFRYPSSYLAVDKTLYPHRGRIRFKQDSPSKPAKYGLLYRLVCDATVPYTYFSLPYAGVPEVLDKKKSSNYVTGTDEYTKCLVNGFSTIANMSGCNVSMDRYFSSVALAQWCSERNITIVGTMGLNRKGIPAEIKKTDKHDERSAFYAHGQDGDLMLVSYVDKMKSGNKNIVVLTSMHDNARVTKDEKRKPQVHTLYDHTKGGVDVVDLVSSNCSTRIKSKRCPLNSLAFILDTARTIANTILKENNVKMSTHEFRYQLFKSSVPTHCTAPIRFIKCNTNQPNDEDKTGPVS